VRRELVGWEVGTVQRNHRASGLGEVCRRAGPGQPAAHDHHVAPLRFTLAALLAAVLFDDVLRHRSSPLSAGRLDLAVRTVMNEAQFYK
jgi:hypothetical protein